MGGQTAELLQTAVASSKSKSSGFLAAAIGIITLIVTASGVFGEMQAALNKVWKAEAKGTTVGRLVQARNVPLDQRANGHRLLYPTDQAFWN
jgi:membrane protein